MPKKKLEESEKKRIEIRFDLKKHGDVISFLENQTDNMAGFIRNIVINYVRSQQSGVVPSLPIPTIKPVTEPTQHKKTVESIGDGKFTPNPKEKLTKKRLPFHNNVIKGTDIKDIESNDPL